MPAEEPFDEYIAKYSNWDRWSNFEIGTANYITRGHVRDAAGTVKLGRVVALGMDIDQNGPQTGLHGRFNCLHYMSMTGTDYAAGQQLYEGKEPAPRGLGASDDMVVFHLQSSTHWDSLCHVFHNGKAFNGQPAVEVSASGSPWSGADKLKGALVGRGVFLDIPRVKGVDSLEDGYAITSEDLDEACEAHQVTVGEGDILFVRTGQLQRARKAGWGPYAGGDAPGLSFWTIPWLAERKVAGLATDTWGVEVRPNELPYSVQPFHIPALVYMGMPLGEMFELEELSEACAEAGAYEMLISAPPLAFVGSAGAPPGPIAII
jgi:kynurenine formamidase